MMSGYRENGLRAGRVSQNTIFVNSDEPMGIRLFSSPVVVKPKEWPPNFESVPGVINEDRVGTITIGTPDGWWLNEKNVKYFPEFGEGDSCELIWNSDLFKSIYGLASNHKADFYRTKRVGIDKYRISGEEKPPAHFFDVGVTFRNDYICMITSGFDTVEHTINAVSGVDRNVFGVEVEIRNLDRIERINEARRHNYALWNSDRNRGPSPPFRRGSGQKPIKLTEGVIDEILLSVDDIIDDGLIDILNRNDLT